jgi:hypothetical protein
MDNIYLGDGYSDEYYAFEYPEEHPYFEYMCNKYTKLVEINDKKIDLLINRFRYLNKIKAANYKIRKIENEIKKLEDLNELYEKNYIEPAYEENDFIDAIETDVILNLKCYIEFFKIDKEELAKESFKPSRVNYILSLDPDYAWAHYEF